VEPHVRISSVQNVRVKSLVKLRKARERRRRRRLLIEGCRELGAALDGGYRPDTVYFCPALFGAGGERAVLADAAAAGAELVETSGAVFAKIAYRENRDGLLAEGPFLDTRLARLDLAAVELLLVVERIEKPGNLGAMLRSAEAAGAGAVLVCDPATDIHNPNVVRASLGALFRVPVAVTDSATAIVALRQAQMHVLAATPEAHSIYWQVAMSPPTALVVGSEQAGMTRPWREAAAQTVRIPMCGGVDSLNAAQTATLLMFEYRRQCSTGHVQASNAPNPQA